MNGQYDATADPSASPRRVAQAWREKSHGVCSRSEDPLVPVLTKCQEALGALIRPGTTFIDFHRALESLELERRNSLQFDEMCDDPLRSLVYGMAETAVAGLRVLTAKGWPAGWQQEYLRREAEKANAAFVAMPALSEQLDEYPSQKPFADGDVKMEPYDGEEEEMMRELPMVEMYNARPARSDVMGYRDDFQAGGDDTIDTTQGDDEEAAAQAQRRLDLARARSMPVAPAQRRNGVIARVPTTTGKIGKRGKPGLLGCPLCPWHSGNTPAVVAAHLKNKHGATTSATGVYFRCVCGSVTRTGYHSKCDTPSFTVVKDADEPFTGKQRAPRRVIGAMSID